MTPQYASPEQLDGEPLTTATDVYSLGLLLYECLVGRVPYRVDESSPRLSGEAIPRTLPLPSVAASQDAASRTLAPSELAGDLDTIVLKALERDPARRYESVADLCADIENLLAGRPVTARRATWGYRAARFVQRNRVGVALTTTIATLLIGGVIGLAILVSRLAAERDRANFEAETANEVTQLLTNLFLLPESDPEKQGPITARDLLDRGAERLEREPPERVEVRSLLDTIIGRTYRQLGEFDRAAAHLQRAYEQRLAHFGPDSAPVADTLAQQGALAYERGDIELVLEIADRQIEVRKKLGDNRMIADAIRGRAAGEVSQDRIDDALATLDEALPFALASEQQDIVAEILVDRGNIHIYARNWPEAEADLERALTIQAALEGVDPLSALNARTGLATAVSAQPGRAEESIPLFDRVITDIEQVLGADNQRLALALHSKAFTLYYDLDRDREAAAALERALSIVQNNESTPMIEGNILSLYASVLTTLGDEERAEQVLRQGIDVLELFAPDGRHRMDAMRRLGLSLCQRGKWEEGIGFTERAMAFYLDDPPPNSDVDQQFMRLEHAECLIVGGRRDEGLARIEEIESIETQSPMREPDVRGLQEELERVRALLD